jgi:hypothetical protein
MLVGAVFMLEFDPADNPCWKSDRISSHLMELAFVKSAWYVYEAGLAAGAQTAFEVTVTVNPDQNHYDVEAMENEITREFAAALDNCFLGETFKVKDEGWDILKGSWIVSEAPKKHCKYFRMINKDSGAPVNLERDFLVDAITKDREKQASERKRQNRL